MDSIEGVTNEVLAQWWCALNRHEWPEALGEPEVVSKVPHSNHRRSSIMMRIEERIGIKECRREWNKERMTDQAFESWWDGGASGIAKALEQSTNS